VVICFIGRSLVISANLICGEFIPKIAHLAGRLSPAAVQQQIASAPDLIPANEVANDPISLATGAAKGVKPVFVRQQGKDRLIAPICTKPGQPRRRRFHMNSPSVCRKYSRTKSRVKSIFIHNEARLPDH
jgi:hypothetical protein